MSEEVDPRIRDLLDRCPNESLAAHCLKQAELVISLQHGPERRIARRAFQRTLLDVIRYGVRTPLSDREARVAMYLSFEVPVSTTRIARDLRMGRQSTAGLLGKLVSKGVAMKLEGGRWLRTPQDRQAAA